ncbi:MAG: imidazole glycerol phosphate synthase subunit HisF [Gemmatimonadota bacterium]
MLRKRVIVCLDVRDGRVVKGVRFRALRDMGDPAELARRYQDEGADEVVFLDISASVEGRRTLLDAVRRTAEGLFVPLTVGGGIASVDDVDRALRAGADKVGVNTAAVARPDLVPEAAARFGSQCVVVSIDAAREAPDAAPEQRAAPVQDAESAARAPIPSGYRVYTHGGRRPTDLDAVEWARRCAGLGAGEILLTSIDRDGGRNGYDLDLTGRVAAAVTVPVIASGGAGRAEHLAEAMDAGADAALAAGIFHDGTASIADVKRALARAGLPVRGVEADLDRPGDDNEEIA